uniref:hypothetical protein n=1 Tax=Clostridium sp. NkU-1 TaxID=1095009 RepID=UPI000AD1F3A9
MAGTAVKAIIGMAVRTAAALVVGMETGTIAALVVGMGTGTIVALVVGMGTGTIAALVVGMGTGTIAALVVGMVIETTAALAVRLAAGIPARPAAGTGRVEICLIRQAGEKEIPLQNVQYPVIAEAASFWTCLMKNSWNRSRSIWKNC